MNYSVYSFYVLPSLLSNPFFFLFHVAFSIICFLILSSVGSNLLSKCSILISSYCICLTCRSYICFCFHICYIIFIACLLKPFLSLSFISLDLANIVVLKPKVCLLIVIHGSHFLTCLLIFAAFLFIALEPLFARSPQCPRKEACLCFFQVPGV